MATDLVTEATKSLKGMGDVKKMTYDVKQQELAQRKEEKQQELAQRKEDKKQEFDLKEREFELTEQKVVIDSKRAAAEARAFIATERKAEAEVYKMDMESESIRIDNMRKLPLARVELRGKGATEAEIEKVLALPDD